MISRTIAGASLGIALGAAALSTPESARAHTLDICAPQVSILYPDNLPAAASPRSFVAQAALFLERVPERDLRKAVDGVPAGQAVPATYIFSGPDTRWRLKSPLSHRQNISNGVHGLPLQAHFLVPSELTRPYGTIVVTGSEDAPGILTNPSMVAHLADGRGIVMEPHDLDADCRLDLADTVDAFHDGLAYFLDHHHHDEDHGGLRNHESGKHHGRATYPGQGAQRSPSFPIPEYDAGRREWNWHAR